ncbi:NACHT domain-containing protein [Streptomyces sp. NPDC008125]|uniref:NACHT domain-containing protein n=1 Tax=Streptomyces sp. NPDC008125 TaxID=3364811 RepID=UPI0036E2A4D6
MRHVRRPRPVRPTDRTVVVQSARQGSGVLLTDRLVLTCAHVLGGEASASVAHPDLPVPVTCRVLWVDAEQDAALLLADGPLPPVPPVRLGVLASAQALPGCEITGFPEIQRYGSGRHLEADQYTATVVPLAGLLRNLLACDLDSPPPVADEDGETLLSGLSGGPVFAGAVLLGLARRIPPRRDGRRVECVSLRPVLESAGFRQAYEQTTASEPRTEQVHGTYPADIRYEEEYADALGAAYRRTRIFGLDELGRRDSEWDLDTAYLSLEAETGGRWTGREAGRVRVPRGRGTDPTPRRIDDLLTDRPRVLLRGDAGAGKTTLLWWLAAHSVAGTLPPRLAALNRLIPFVVPLRTLRAREERLPAPAGLPEAARLAVDTAPDGWAGRVLESGRGLLLVDGLDEVPPGEREEAYTWLTRLLARYPQTRCVATVRPLAVEPDWLAAEGFEELRLLPLRDEDIQAFVAAWHKAARLDDDDHGRLHELERDLARQFRGNRTLSDLARTPLLCAVICALHRRQEGFLPNTRWKLYRSALGMLLGNRDQRRGITDPEGITMEVEEQMLLLQRIAIWLVREGQTEFSRDQALRQLDRALAGMERVRKQGTTDAILTHLLNRSGLLQERADDSYQFAHRTFQDYLAAAEFVESDQINELLRVAHDESWADVIALASGHCGRSQLSALVNGLLDQAQSYDEDALGAYGVAAVRVLAALCAQQATWLDDGTRERIRAALTELFPPSSLEMADLLGSLGADALAHLPDPSALPADPGDGRFTVWLLGAVGGREALAYARAWVAASPASAAELSTEWPNFPTEEFARDVLAGGNLDGAHLSIGSRAELLALPHLGPAGRALVLTLDGPFEEGDLRHGLRHIRPESLTHLRNPLLTDLSVLHDSEHLRRLAVDGCPGVTDLAPLKDWPALRRLILRDDHVPMDRLTVLREVPWLHHLQLKLASAIGHLSELPPLPGLRELALDASGAVELDNLGEWTSLQLLRLRKVSSPASLMTALRAAPRVTAVSLTHALDGPWPRHEEPLPQLSALSLMVGPGSGADLRPLRDLFPDLRRLTLRGRAGTTIDVSPLRGWPTLHIEVLLNGGSLVGAEGLEDARLTVTAR